MIPAIFEAKRRKLATEKAFSDDGNLIFDCDVNFDDLSRMTNPSGVKPSVGDRIASITDRISGLVLNERNSGGPTLRGGGPGGRRWAKFDSSLSGGMRGVVADWLSGNAGHIWAIVRVYTKSPTLQIVWGSTDEASSTAANFYCFWRGTTNNFELYQQASADVADRLLTADDPDPAAVFNNGDVAAGPGNWVVLHWYSNGTTIGYDVNGIAGTPVVAAGGNNGDWTHDTPGRDNLCLGCIVRTTASNFADVGLARFCAVSGNMSASDLSAVTNYFSAYYGRFRNIGVLGDSWSDPVTSWTERARDICASHPKFQNWNWVNCAIGGQSAEQIRDTSWTANLQRAAAQLDAVVWMGTLNDMNDDVVPTPEPLFAEFKATADEVLAAGCKLVIGEVGPWGGTAGNWTLARQQKQQAYTDMQRAYAAANSGKVYFVPLYDFLKAGPDGNQPLRPTNAAGVSLSERIAGPWEQSGGSHVNATCDPIIAGRMIEGVARAVGDWG